MRVVKEYRTRADEAERLAEKLRFEHQRERTRDLAKRWRRLANDREQTMSGGEPPNGQPPSKHGPGS